MTNSTRTIETVDLLKLIHKGHARLRVTPKDTDREAELIDALACAVSIMALNIRNERFEAQKHQVDLIEYLTKLTSLTLAGG